MLLKLFIRKMEKQKIGRNIGYIVMYFVFTTILYFVLRFLGKLPEIWDYFTILFLTLILVIIGKLIKRGLK